MSKVGINNRKKLLEWVSEARMEISDLRKLSNDIESQIAEANSTLLKYYIFKSESETKSLDAYIDLFKYALSILLPIYVASLSIPSLNAQLDMQLKIGIVVSVLLILLLVRRDFVLTAVVNEYREFTHSTAEIIVKNARNNLSKLTAALEKVMLKKSEIEKIATKQLSL